MFVQRWPCVRCRLAHAAPSCGRLWRRCALAASNGLHHSRRDPRKTRRQKEAAQQLKNIKLQHTGEDDTVLFEDVAGIGDAKARVHDLVGSVAR